MAGTISTSANDVTERSSRRDETITGRLAKFAAACGRVLARAHARSGDAAAINDYLGASAKVEQAFVSFASAYADQNERDHAQFARAVEQGSIPSAVGWGERR